MYIYIYIYIYIFDSVYIYVCIYSRYILSSFFSFIGFSVKVPKKPQICYTIEEGYDTEVSRFYIAISRQALQRKQRYRENLYLLTEY